ncbi:MAG: energy transducer TonB [Myxococcota bacterium]
MFDNVGKSLDEDATKRSFASMLIASLLIGSTAAFTVGYGMLVVVKEIEAAYTEDCTNGIDDDGDGLIDMEDPDCALVEVIIDDEIPDAAAPPPPPPPPPAAADSSEEEEEDEETEEEPEDMVDEQKELKEDVKTEVKSQERPAGEKDGVKDGVEGGQKDGVKDGIKDGVVGGDLNAGIRSFHHSELEVKKRKLPTYPEAAESMNLGDQKCKVSVTIDEKGVPFKAIVKDCPKVFHAEAEQAILEWRWYPPKAGGEKVKAQTLIAIIFKAR